MSETLKGRNYFRYSPLLVLVWGIISILFLPVVPIASGFGWDGVFYGRVAMDFSNMIGGMDNYHSGRIFPGVLIHYVLKLLRAPLTVPSALFAYQVYTVCVLTLSAWLWVGIGERALLSSTAQWTGFMALFIGYPVINLYFYYPSLTDITVFAMGMAMLYAYLTRNRPVLLVVSALAFFCWPTGIVIGMMLFIWSGVENTFWVERRRGIWPFLLIVLALSPLLFEILRIANIDSVVHFAATHGLGGQRVRDLTEDGAGKSYDWLALVSSLVLVGYLLFIYWRLLYDFNLAGFVRASFKKGILLRGGIALVILVTLSLLKRTLFDPTLSTVTLGSYLYDVVHLSTRFPLQFLVCPISYWGPVVLLLLLFFRSWISFVKRTHFPLMLGLLFTLLFSINAESRAITNFYPMIVFGVVSAIDFSRLKNDRLFIGLFLGTSLLYSKIWLPIHLPATVFPTTIDKGLEQFPMQWYFMNFGPWINGQMYLLHALAAVVFFGVFYFVTRYHNRTL